MTDNICQQCECSEFARKTVEIDSTYLLILGIAYNQCISKNDALMTENAKLRELLQRLLAEYRYLRVRPRKMYLQHEQRMRAIEDEMCELGIEVGV